MCEEYKILNLLSTEKIIFSNYDGHYIECDDKEITLYLTNENIIFTYGRAGHKSFNIKKYSLLDIVCVLLNTKEYNDKIEQYPTLKICFKNQEVLFEFEEIEFSEKWSELIRIALCEKLPIGKSLCPECGAILDTHLIIIFGIVFIVKQDVIPLIYIMGKCIQMFFGIAIGATLL